MSIYKRLIFYLIFVSVLGQSCAKKNHKTALQEAKVVEQTDTLSLFDTTIYLPINTSSSYNGENLTDTLAKNIMEDYAKNLEFICDCGLIVSEDTAFATKFCFWYDTIFTFNLNENKFRDAVVSYNITPYRASGHCYQPYKAIIIDSDNGYMVIHKEFIPQNYTIDSLVIFENSPTIFGHNYDCGEHKYTEKLRIKLKSKPK